MMQVVDAVRKFMAGVRPSTFALGQLRRKTSFG
jgi:hypothetical protein